jgi:hypothetical protein
VPGKAVLDRPEPVGLGEQLQIAFTFVKRTGGAVLFIIVEEGVDHRRDRGVTAIDGRISFSLFN